MFPRNTLGLANINTWLAILPLVFFSIAWWPRNPDKSAAQRGQDAAANRTLGKILTISKEPSWRTVGLLAAANFTGLDITIPTQPLNPPALVSAFSKLGSGKQGVKTPKHGSALAWLAHLDMIKFVVASGFTSALILEDDVDWDVDILRQMQLVSTHISELTSMDAKDESPYGSNWDILWLGHCGERSDLEVRHVQYPDETRIEVDQYSGWSKKYWMSDIPPRHRRIQKAMNPVCTFAYAITKQSAQRVLDFLGRGADEAYDVAMQHQCVMGNLRCLVVSPQLFNHHEPSEESGYISIVGEGDGGGTSTILQYAEGKTANIVQSARCKALFNDTCLAPPTEPNYLDPVSS